MQLLYLPGEMKICFLIISRCPLTLVLTQKLLLFVLKSTWFDIDAATLDFHMDSSPPHLFTFNLPISFILECVFIDNIESGFLNSV